MDITTCNIEEPQRKEPPRNGRFLCAGGGGEGVGGLAVPRKDFRCDFICFMFGVVQFFTCFNFNTSMCPIYLIQ